MTLTTSLQRHRNEIAAIWTDRAYHLPGSRYEDHAQDEISAWGARAIDAIIRGCESGSDDLLRAHATEMARERAEQGFGIDEVLAGLLLLNEAALPFIFGDCGGARDEGIEAALALDACVRLMAVEFAALFAASMRQAVGQVAMLEERHRLARDIHDSLSQSLCGVGLCAEAAARLLEAGDVPTAVAHLRDVRDSAGDALREMRFLLFDLRPSILHEEGLVSALAARVAAVERRMGVQVELAAGGVERLPFAVEEALYGIAREALNNSLKHGHATRLTVTVRQSEEDAGIEVADNGVGFDPDEGWRRGGMGLAGMRERAHRIGASFEVSSEPGCGTTIRVSAPVGGHALVREEPS
jgi:signal transduction histidine kinase